MSSLIEPDLIFKQDNFSLVKVPGHQILNNIRSVIKLQESEQSIVYLVEYTGLQGQSVVEKKAVIKVFTYDRFDELKKRTGRENIQKVLDEIINGRQSRAELAVIMSKAQFSDNPIDELLKKHEVTLEEGIGFQNEKRETIFKMLNNKGASELAEREYELANRLKGDLEGKTGIVGELCPEFIFEYEYDKKNNPNVIISDTEMNIVPYDSHPAISTKYQITEDIVDRLISGERQVDPVISQIFPIIHCIHQGGFYHRDIKPQNFVISRPGGRAPPKIHLIDFGLSLRDNELGTDKVFYVDSTMPYLSPYMIRAIDLHDRPEDQQREILIANDYWGAICTIIYYLNNKPWWDYTDYGLLAIDGVITKMPRTPTNQILWKTGDPPSLAIFKIFERFFYHMIPPPGGGRPKERTVTEYTLMIQSIMFPRGGGAMRGRKKRTKRKNQSSTKSRTRKPKTKKKRTKKKRTKKKHRTRRK